jgi:hypothetical protein
MSQESSSDQVTATPGSASIGYCHVCDRQVNIDQDSFTCSVCHGGFIELFDMERAAAAQDEAASSASTSPNGVTVDALRFNQTVR